MRVLFLSQIVPYPPDAGPRVKTWQVLRYLVERGHQVTLACFVRPEEEAYLPAVRQLCARVYTVQMRRSRLADIGHWLRSQSTGRPFLIERDDLPAMRSLVNRLIASGEVDVLHADQFSMAQFGITGGVRNRSQKQPFLIFDAHNAVWTIVVRMLQTAPLWLKPVVALEARRVKRYEGMIVRDADHTLVVTEPDRQAILQAVEASGADPAGRVQDPLITVIPIAVDTKQLHPVTRQPGSNNLVTLGTLHYPPNADGIRWFAREAFPLIQKQAPACRLTIIGKNPPKDFLKLAEHSGGAITVTGYVPDLVPYLEQAALMVIPVRAGGGMRVRILEAFSRGIPVVTTTVGLEGIEAVPGRDVLVADTPEDLAASVMRLMGDHDLQERLSHNSRKLAESLYDWRVALQKLDGVYEETGYIPAAAPLMEKSREHA